jgi:hypothetical protein
LIVRLNLQRGWPLRERRKEILLTLGGILLLGLIFGVPAVLIPVTMNDVPKRSETKALTVYQDAVDLVHGYFNKHENYQGSGRLMPLPQDSMSWIQLMNPMGRKAPSGGYAILTKADPKTGAIGVAGDDNAVTVTLPAYRTLSQENTTIFYRRPKK